MSLLAAGSNAQGQLATLDRTDAHTFTRTHFADTARLPQDTRRVSQLACGANHTLVLLDRGRLELWGAGDGSRGQLGPAVRDAALEFVPLDLPLAELGLEGGTVRAVAAGWETSYVVLGHPERGDVLLSMGADDFGDLGVGGAPKQEARRVHRVEFGDECLGEGTPSRVLIQSLAAGPHHVVVQLSIEYPGDRTEQRLVGWGTSRHGQLGDLKNPQTGRPLPFVDRPVPIPLPSPDPITQISLGNQHTVLLLSSGRIHALGSNRRSQLTGLANLHPVSTLGCTWNGTYALTQDTTTWLLLSTGSAHKGQLGRPATDAPAPVQFPFTPATHDLVKLACGSEHVLCLFVVRDGAQVRREVWAWGWNEHGTLGNGDTVDQALPVRVWPPDEHAPAAVDVAAGCGNSWIMLESSEQPRMCTQSESSIGDTLVGFPE